MNIEKTNKEKRVNVSTVLFIAAAILMMLYLLQTLPHSFYKIDRLGVVLRVLYIFIACSIAVPTVLSKGITHKVFKIILAVWFALGFIGIFLYFDHNWQWGVFK